MSKEICSSCNHDREEHRELTEDEIKDYESKFGRHYPCGHDDYVDDGGERIHNICKCEGFK